MTFGSHLNRRSVLRLFAGGAAFAIGGPEARAEHPRMTRLIGKAEGLPSIGERIVFISRALIGTPYRGHTLVGGPRKAEQFVNRDGAVAWRERNHYFSQWRERNVANRKCRPVAVPGGGIIDKTLAFMPDLGPQRMQVAAVPRASLLSNKQLLASGDIIGFLSEHAKLDYFHIGFVIVAPDGGLWLRHASKSRRRVLDEPLARFLRLNRVKAVTLLRPREPNDASVVA